MASQDTAKRKIILAVNAGSSSVKISAYTASYGQQPKQLAEASVSGLTSPPATLDYSRGGKSIATDQKIDLKPQNQAESDKAPESAASKDEQESVQATAFRHILETLTSDKALPEISKKDDIALVAHRIVHGGDYTSSQVITKDTYHHLETLNDLAPLHNAKGLEIIKSCMTSLLPGSTNVACFDSQFHATIPEHIRTYPIDQDVAEKNGLRKYGFHGLSYAFIVRSVAEFLEKKVEATSVIALHLGSGASACAVDKGRSRDTSMGLTPLAGLPGATRSGSIDPSLVFHYASNVGKLSPKSTKELHISRAEEILNQESGWKALTGTTNFGTITASAQSSSPDPKAKLAFDLLVDRISGYVGSYYVSLKGKVDALVFAGGIGEKSDVLRKAVVDQVACLGFAVDHEKNGKKMQDIVTDISQDGGSSARHKVLVCLTDEQFEMARDCTENSKLWS